MEVELLQTEVKKLKDELRALSEQTSMLEKEIPEKKKREFPSIDERQTADLRSIFVRGFPPQTTASELAQFFMAKVGTVERSTVMMSRITGTSLGYAYIQFQSIRLANLATELSDDDRTFHVGLFNGVPVNVILMVIPKRTNLPGFRKLHTLIKPLRRLSKSKKNESKKVSKKNEKQNKRDPKMAKKIAKHLLQNESFDYDNIPRINIRNKTFNSGYRERVSMKDNYKWDHTNQQTSDNKVKIESEKVFNFDTVKTEEGHWNDINVKSMIPHRVKLESEENDELMTENLTLNEKDNTSTSANIN